VKEGIITTEEAKDLIKNHTSGLFLELSTGMYYEINIDELTDKHRCEVYYQESGTKGVEDGGWCLKLDGKYVIEVNWQLATSRN
jgi:predicted  nucleic acid-binding Zn-ribbon protein